jgi:hypothetical protein
MRRTVRPRGRSGALLAVALVAGLVSLPANGDPMPPSDTLAGTVYLPDGRTPAAAAIVDLMLADPAGQPIAGTAFARGIAGLDGQFSVNPRERDDLVAAARANGGDLLVAVQVGKLAAHGTLDPAALPGLDTPDTALALASTTLRLVTTQHADGTSSTAFGFYADRPVLGDLQRIAGTGVDIVLGLSHGPKQSVQVLGMVNDPDLVAGWENTDDPDLIPPLGVIVANAVPTLDLSVSAGAAPSGTVRLLPPLPKQQKGDGGGSASCARDSGTQWVDDRHGHNNPPHSLTYVYLDTYSCTGDNDPQHDEVIYDWTGYSGVDDKSYTIYRVKFRTQIADNADYTMKKPNPVGDQNVSQSSQLNWTVGWDKLTYAAVSGSYHFAAKKIHGWQADGTGRLYHVSWISNNNPRGSYGQGFNTGGGVRFEVPEGDSGRTDVSNSVILWLCQWLDKDHFASSCDD